MKQNNSDQRDFWSGASGTSWIAHEKGQDALLESVAKHVVSQALMQSGEHVIDIGCGTGALSQMAAEAVGKTGKVLATDISEPLLSRAGDRLSGYPQVATQLGDVAVADWNGTRFDLAISRFGVMFFADPTAAFRNMAAALRPGGRMIFAAWAAAALNPYWSLGISVAASRLGPLAPGPANAPGPMGLSDVTYANSVLKKAGFQDFRVTPTALLLEFPGTLQELADLMVKVGPTRRFINAHNASSVRATEIRDEIARCLARFERANGAVALPATINMITAKRL